MHTNVEYTLATRERESAGEWENGRACIAHFKLGYNFTKHKFLYDGESE